MEESSPQMNTVAVSRKSPKKCSPIEVVITSADDYRLTSPSISVAWTPSLGVANASTLSPSETIPRSIISTGTVRTRTTPGSRSLSPPAAVSSKHGHLDVFHRSVDKGVYVKHLADSTWSSWVNLGGKTEGNLATVSWGPDLVDVFALGGAEGQTPYRKTKNGETWSSAWEDLEGRLKSELAAVSWSPGRIDVFGIGLNDAMYTRSYSGGRWLAGWTSLGGSFSSPPTVVSRGPGLLDVFAVDKSGIPQRKSFNSVWSDWQSPGGVLYTAMSAKVTSFFGTKRIDIFALGGADRVYQKTYNGVTSKWEGWTSHGTAFDTEPALASWGSDRLDILCIGKSSDMRHQSWNGTSWEPSLETWASNQGSFKKFP